RRLRQRDRADRQHRRGRVPGAPPRRAGLSSRPTAVAHGESSPLPLSRTACQARPVSTAIDGWYDSGRGLIAWFAASSHAHAASLVEPVLDLVGGRGPWPLLDVRGTGVRVRLSRACPDSPALAASLTTAALRLGLNAD